MPESNFLIRVAPSYLVKLVPFQADANTPQPKGIQSHSKTKYPYYSCCVTCLSSANLSVNKRIADLTVRARRILLTLHACGGILSEMHSPETAPEAEMATTQQFALPHDKFRLEEINMPEELAASLAGQTVTVEAFPEELLWLRLRRGNGLPGGVPMLIDKDDEEWNDVWPLRVLYTDSEGRIWRLPRHWLSRGVSPVIEASHYTVNQESSWLEHWVTPTWWDLWDVNIEEAPAAVGRQPAADIKVSVAPGEIPKAIWKGPSGKTWRIPHDWRRRRIKLPDCDGLLRNGFRQYRAKEFGGRIVTVNYHPGSLCCLHDGYRVKDRRGKKWLVRAADCMVVGFGDERERHA